MKKYIKITLLILLVLFLIFVSFASLGFYRMYQKNKTEEAISRINNTVIDLDDVMGKNLPPKPDQIFNDSSVAGFDVNNNKIRDDVELAIFERYPNSAKVRAGMLQYAQALQLELIEVFNSETLVTSIKKENIAFFCLGEANDKELYNNQTEIENLVLNTEMRNKKFDEIYEYMTTYSSPQNKECDINLSLLPN